MKAILVVLVLLSMLPGSEDDPYRKARLRMVSTQIEARDIVHKATIRAMKTVPRHRFVPESMKHRAYDDGPLPIGYGQTISQPYIVAYMTGIIKPKKKDRVLEIGTGSGYQAAILSRIVGKVYTIEIVSELYGSASRRLKSLGYGNVACRHADGYNGWKEHAPFDAIVVTAAGDHIPPPLVKQLKEGGRMIIPVGHPFRVQHLMLVEKVKGKAKTRSVMPVRFVPFTRGE